MKCLHFIYLKAFALLFCKITNANALFSWSEDLVKTTKIAGQISYALEFDGTLELPFEAQNVQDFVYEPDRAVMVQTSGKCFAVFRSTTAQADDWAQNAKPGVRRVCNTIPGSSHGQSDCCAVGSGWYDAYNAPFRADLEAVIRDCIPTCDDPTNCLIVAGYSQGSNIAGVAALYLADLNPYLIGFGMAPTVASPCLLLDSNRWYRFVNTRLLPITVGSIGLGYDMFAMWPIGRSHQWGHVIFFPADNNSTGIFYNGLDNQEILEPRSWEAHDMFESYGENKAYYPGYIDHLTFLIDQHDAASDYPIVPTGYIDGSLCSLDKECQSGICEVPPNDDAKHCIPN